MMDFSFQLYSSREADSQAAFLDTLSQLGYRQVEGYGGVYNDPQKFRAALDAADLTMPSGHFSLSELEDDLPNTLKLATTLGTAQLFCPFLSEAERPTDASGWKAFGEQLSNLGKRINDKGFRFGWHNHDFEFIACNDGAIPMRVILESAPDIDWEMDVAWTARAGSDPSEWITEFGSRITAAHVKDIAPAGECDDEDGWADVGFGTIDWKSLMALLQKESNAQLFIAEHDNPSDHQRFASRSLQSLKSYL